MASRHTHKRNAFLVFTLQSPADALRSTISHSILEQVATKIFLPNPFGQRRDYIEGFALPEAEFKLVREELSPESRKFLVKQGHDSVVVGLDLVAWTMNWPCCQAALKQRAWPAK
jgi:type IV secretion system protein VirB4